MESSDDRIRLGVLWLAGGMGFIVMGQVGGGVFTDIVAALPAGNFILSYLVGPFFIVGGLFLLLPINTGRRK